MQRTNYSQAIVSAAEHASRWTEAANPLSGTCWLSSREQPREATQSSRQLENAITVSQTMSSFESHRGSRALAGAVSRRAPPARDAHFGHLRPSLVAGRLAARSRDNCSRLGHRKPTGEWHWKVSIWLIGGGGGCSRRICIGQQRTATQVPALLLLRHSIDRISLFDGG